MAKTSETTALQKWSVIVTIAVTAGGLLFGVAQYLDTRSAQEKKVHADRVAQQRELHLDQQAEAVQRRIEATKPFLERQLQLYTDATRSAAIIAASSEQAAVSKAKERFYELFWGELALVEDREVEGAMVSFEGALASNASRDELEQLSLQLAHACRESLAKSWNTTAWQSHYVHPESQKVAAGNETEQ